MNPYEELGVARDADAGAIKAAYRRRAQRAHPDRGGSSESFALVQKSYEILSDPERRRRFDETGDDGAFVDVDAGFLNGIAMAVLGAMDACDVDHVDVQRALVTAMRDGIVKLRAQRKSIEQAIEKRRRAAERWHRKVEGDNVIRRLVEGDIAVKQHHLAQLDAQIASAERTIAFLEEYRYEVDPRAGPAPRGYDPFSSAQAAFFQQMGGGQR